MLNTVGNMIFRDAQCPGVDMWKEQKIIRWEVLKLYDGRCLNKYKKHTHSLTHIHTHTHTLKITLALTHTG